MKKDTLNNQTPADAKPVLPAVRVKLDWLVSWMKENQRADVINTELVDAYEKEFKVNVSVMIYGPNRCKDLGKTLSLGYKLGLFKRQPVGLANGAWNVGFPKWVYVYELR